MTLNYDPADGLRFWQALEKLPGYPAGEHAPIPIMRFESDLLFELPAILRLAGADPAQPCLVVMDHTPMQRLSRPLKPQILQVLNRAGWHAQAVYAEPDATGQVHTDMPHIEAVKAHLQPGAAVLAVGSGTICDIAKHAAFLFDREHGGRLPFVVFQTANSVSAFTSNMAPTFIDGVKRTLPSRYPDALACDLETLAGAPYEMTSAGVGDLLAAFVSMADWYLAHQLGMDPTYSELAQRLMGPLDEIFLQTAPAIRSRSAQGMAVLAKLIALGGLAMSLSHATAPMSGYEHVMSHTLDLLAESAGMPLAMHGTQVALTSLLGADVYEHFLAEFEPAQVKIDACYPDADAMQAVIRSTFLEVDPSGKAGDECWADYRQKLANWHAQRPAFEAFLHDWPRHKAALTALSRPRHRLLEILDATAAPTTFAGLQPSFNAEQVRFAFLNAPLLRKRLTLGDLLIFMKWDRSRLWRSVWAG